MRVEAKNEDHRDRYRVYDPDSDRQWQYVVWADTDTGEVCVMEVDPKTLYRLTGETVIVRKPFVLVDLVTGKRYPSKAGEQ